jgi:polysaccharide biosynthesis protein PslG
LRNRLSFVLGAAALVAVTGLNALAPLPAATAAAPPAAPYQARSPEYGMSVFVYGNPGTTERDLSKLTGIGFSWQKSLFRWRDIETDCKGCYNWGEADRVVKSSADAGLKIIARLDFQPTWARVDGAHNGAPDNYQDFADFVSAFMTRYKTGSPNGTVQAIEIWNEVNLQREWGNAISPASAADYVRLLGMAYKAAKAADPNVLVITAGLSPTGWNDDTARPDDDFLGWMYLAGLKGGKNYDVLGAHGNTQCPSVDAGYGNCPVLADRMSHPSFYFRRIEQLRQIMVDHGDSAQQVWLLEFGWTTDPVNPSYSWYATSESRKADLIVEAFKYANRNWAPWIGVMTLWTLSDPGWSPGDEQVYWAVTNPDGSPRPAYDRLVQARALGELP